MVNRGVLEESKVYSTSPRNMAVDIANSSGIIYPVVCPSTTVPQEKDNITLSAEDRAVAEAIDAIDDLTSDFEVVTDDSNTEEVPSDLTPKRTKCRNTQMPKPKSTAEPFQTKNSPRTGSLDNSPDNNNPGPFPSQDACDNSPKSSLWADDESWDTPSYLRYDPERPILYPVVPPRKKMRQRVASLKHKVVKIARTDLDWVKGAMVTIRIKAGAEFPRLKVNSADNIPEGSKNSSGLSLRGGAGDISSLNDGGNDIFGFGVGIGSCVSIYTIYLPNAVRI